MEFVIRRAVYKSEDGCFFSEGVKRDFGENKVISLFDGGIEIGAVQPLKCEPLTNGLSIVGTIGQEI